MDYKTTCVIENGHPGLDGHFPGNPVVPGVVILNKVIQAVHDWKGVRDIAEIMSVKFMAPVRPDMFFDIILLEQNTHGIKFECCHDKKCIVKGSIKLSPEAGAL